MTLVRAFVALPCPPGLRAAIARKIGEWKGLGADVSWTDPGEDESGFRFGIIPEGLGPGFTTQGMGSLFAQ